MLHRTLTPPFLHFSSLRPLSATQPSAPPHSPPPLPSYLSSAQAEREARMEGVEVSALKKACRPEAPQPAPWQGQENQSFVLPDDVAWAVERGGFLGEEFSVDDLLDFDGLEPDKESEKEEEDKGDAFEAVNHKNSTSTSSASSAVSFEDPPLSDINLPTHDAAEFEWMSSIIDDSLLEYPPSAGVPPPYRPATHSEPQPKTHLPPPGENLCIISTEALVPVKAKRSKRPRIAGSAWPTAGATALSDSSASSTTTTTTTTSSSSCSSSPSYTSYLVTNHVSFLFDANPPQPKKQNPKKRGRKPKSHHVQNNNHHHHQPPPHAAAAGMGGRHCTHCGAQKTPQWRTGPMGPKTLCNACGVRYKSGRLVPEYRPAASPTFVSHVHSNSHRKVLEMRRKKEEQFISAAAPPVSSF